MADVLSGSSARWKWEAVAVALDLPGIIVAGKELIHHRIKTLRERNKRADVVRLLPRLSAEDQNKLFAHVRRLEQTAEPIYENDLMNGLGDVLPEKDGKVADDAAAVFLTWVANLEGPRFDAFAYMILHDPFAQKVKYYLSWAIENQEEILEVLGVFERAIKEVLVRGLMFSFGVETPMELRGKLRPEERRLRNRIILQRGVDENGNKLRLFRRTTWRRRLLSEVYKCMGW